MKTLKPKNNQVSDGYKAVNIKKSYQETSKSFVTPDYSNKTTWYYDTTSVVDELSIDTGDQKNYTFATGRSVINLDKVTERISYLSKAVSVKKNDIVITTGFSIDFINNKVIFTSANLITDIVKVSYHYANSSKYDLIASAGKKILVDYVESQFSIGTIINDTLRFEMILNNSSTGNTDVVLGYMEYKSAADFLNKGNHGVVMGAFGELTKDVNIFPWNYLSGFTIKPVGDATTNPNKNEFSKVRIYLKNDQPYTNCELATACFYCMITSL
jgi:hypothetical protein